MRRQCTIRFRHGLIARLSLRLFPPSLHHTHPYLILMLRASTTSNRSQRLSQDDNTDGAHDHDQSTRLDNLPPTSNDTPPPADEYAKTSSNLGALYDINTATGNVLDFWRCSCQRHLECKHFCPDSFASSQDLQLKLWAASAIRTPYTRTYFR